jgi:hypothetical protein
MIWNIFEKFNNSPAGLFPLTILSRVRGGAGGIQQLRSEKFRIGRFVRRNARSVETMYLQKS